MLADPLSEVLALVDARCVISRGFSIGGEWSLHLLPRARLKLIAVERGSCWLTVDGVEQPLRLEAGDVAVLSDRTSDVLSSDPALDPVDATELFARSPEPLVRISEPSDVVVVGGHVELNRGGEDLLLGSLAPLTHIRAKADEAAALRWLLGRLMYEMSTHREGAHFASQQYAQLLFLEVLRAYLSDAHSFPPGWLRALADERISPALRLMHSAPERAWHLDELSKSVSMSRTTFAARFKSVAGVPPLTYLYQWRMHIAQNALRAGEVPISDLASTLGYSSESAFSNAFKRTNGVAPRRYRDLAQAAALAVAVDDNSRSSRRTSPIQSVHPSQAASGSG